MSVTVIKKQTVALITVTGSAFNHCLDFCELLKGKASGKELHYGICGEHGGDPVSVEFCHKIGLNYVSCSPFRVPIARLAAAQAAIADMK